MTERLIPIAGPVGLGRREKPNVMQVIVDNLILTPKFGGMQKNPFDLGAQNASATGPKETKAPSAQAPGSDASGHAPVQGETTSPQQDDGTADEQVNHVTGDSDPNKPLGDDAEITE